MMSLDDWSQCRTAESCCGYAMDSPWELLRWRGSVCNPCTGCNTKQTYTTCCCQWCLLGLRWMNPRWGLEGFAMQGFICDFVSCEDCCCKESWLLNVLSSGLEREDWQISWTSYDDEIHLLVSVEGYLVWELCLRECVARWWLNWIGFSGWFGFTSSVMICWPWIAC